MKRFWLVLLSLGLIVAFSTSAMAVDVKFSGEYYAAGLYLDKVSVVKDSTKTWIGTDQYTRTALPALASPMPVTRNGVTAKFTDYWKPNAPQTASYYTQQKQSTAFYFQRLRLNTQIVVSPGLSLITRADAMERAWGAARSNTGTALDALSAGTPAENENIAFDLAYVSYVSPIGKFDVGYQIDGAWGTEFGNNSIPTGKVAYFLPIGSLIVGLQTGKVAEWSRTSKNVWETTSDSDDSFYTALVRYAWKGGDAGLLFRYNQQNSGRNSAATEVQNGIVGPIPTTPGTTALGIAGLYLAADANAQVAKKAYLLSPYAKAKLGPVALQAQIYYLFGEAKFEDSDFGRFQYGEDKLKIDQLTAWVDATADFGMGYAGATIAYISGDDPGTLDKVEGGSISGGLDWNPCLIMFNSDLDYWAGAINGYDNAASRGAMSNAWFFQVRGGVRPVEKLDIGLSISYANADKKPSAAWLYNDYGYEVDLTGTYKLTNNLSYMLGGGYLMTGKYFQGKTEGSVADDFMVINKLTLTF